MAMRWWFDVEKVDPPSEEPPPDNPILTLSGMVMEKDDIPFYRLFDYGSYIEVYPMPTYFLARQYARDWRAKTSTLYAEYRLTLTDEAWRVVNKLLKAPFECYAENESAWKDYLYYKCETSHQAYIPTHYNGNVIQARWYFKTYIRKIEVEILGLEYNSTIPFNCGPLRPLWERAVECWIKKISMDIGPDHTAATYLTDIIRHRLLEQKYIHPYTYIIPVYNIY